MANIFISKSRGRAENKAKKEAPSHKITVIKDICTVNYILWIGKDVQDFFKGGKSFGFLCSWLDMKDLSILVHAKCLVVSYVDVIDDIIRIVNFSCEYGIPVVWLHRHLPPENLFWSFHLMFNEQNKRAFWEKLCLLV